MKLYYSKGACSLTQHILLELSGLPFETEAVNLRTKKTESGKDFYKINPRGQVPTLVLDDGTILLENIAIAEYIADRVPEKNLIAPINQIDRYQALAWLSYAGTTLHSIFGTFFTSQDPNVLADATDDLISNLEMLNDYLAERTYIATETFTVADAFLFVLLSWRTSIEGLPDFPHLDRYCDQIGRLEAVKKASADEHSI